VRIEVLEERWRVIVHGETVLLASQVPGIQAVNLACALAAGVALGFDPARLASRIPQMVPVANRLTVSTAPSGVMVIDDTYNSNPAGAAAALQLLAAAPVEGRRVVVTPGMVELGRLQSTENEAFAGAATLLGATVLIVGRTNARALGDGVQARAGTPLRVPDRERAVAWVRAELGPGDAVLYENDLPDHYP
jgi:UDP-N-acetylmuramoyl-tripeptide--D-alanyl-D-alanine ligase